jgi:hypothetical protein
MPKGKQVGTTLKKKKSNGARSAPKRRSVGLSDRFTGMGPMVEAPRAMARQSRGTAPRIQSSRTRGGVHVHHTEWIADLSPGTAAFTSVAYPINPGIGTLFPWLASVASRFDSYRFSNLQFMYEARASSDTVGTVSIAVNYDASDTAPTSKAQLNSLETRVDTVPWQQAVIRCMVSELDGTILKHKVRQGTVPNTDVKMYDAGNFIVVTSGVTTAPPFLGELWVTYDVDLFSPLLVDPLGGFIQSGGDMSSITVPFGTAPTVLGALPVSPTSTGLVFNQTFEGVMTIQCEIGTNPGWVLTIGGTAAVRLLYNVLTDYSDEGINSYAISGALGQTITINTGIPMTSVTCVITPGPFDVLSQL